MRRSPRLRDDSGATAVEFAICLPVVLMFVLMTMYGGMYVFYGAMADHVARTVARDVAIPTTKTGSAYPDQGSAGQVTVEDKAKRAAAGLLPDPTSVGVMSARSDIAPGDEVTVTVTYEPGALDFISGVLWFLPDPDHGISRSASARRE